MIVDEGCFERGCACHDSRESPGVVVVKREWRGLTEEEIYPLYSEPSSDAEMVEFARAVEAALRSKNYD